MGGSPLLRNGSGGSFSCGLLVGEDSFIVARLPCRVPYLCFRRELYAACVRVWGIAKLRAQDADREKQVLKS